MLEGGDKVFPGWIGCGKKMLVASKDFFNSSQACLRLGKDCSYSMFGVFKVN